MYFFDTTIFHSSTNYEYVHNVKLPKIRRKGICDFLYTFLNRCTQAISLKIAENERKWNFFSFSKFQARQKGFPNESNVDA